MKKSTLILAALFASMAVSAKTITLDLTHPTNPEAFTFNEAGMWTETWNDQDYPWFETQEFAFSHILSGNSYGGTSWEGFTVSKATKDGEGYGYYSNMAKGGLAGEGTPYILAYYSEYWLMNEDNEDMMSSNQIIFGEPLYPQYVYLNNALVSYENIKNGGGAARPFAQGDKFEVWIQGITEDLDDVTDEKVVYRLADYTSENQEEWFVNTEWAKVDLTPLGKVYGLAFTVVSTDQGIYGTNTATYFALDGLTVEKPLQVATFEDVNIPDPESALHLVLTDYIQSGSFLFQQEVNISEYGTYYYGNLPTNKSDNTYASYLDAEKSASGGAYEGSNFVVWTASYMGLDSIALDHADVVPGFFVNNTAYAVNSMLKGDDYAKKFGKDDWFRLTITGSLNGVAVNNEVKVDLAADGKYINQWTYVDLSSLGEVDAIQFSLWSSDVVTYDEGVTYYMNTPAYFAMDNFGAQMPEGYVAPEKAEFPAEEGIEDTEAAVKAVKVLRGGQIVIVRGEAEYTVTGLRVK
jgi:hypothetical protein